MKTGIFTFGDKLPSGKDTDFFVSYKVDGVPGGMLSGPYDNRDHAESELLDVRTYEHVREAKLVTRAELHRTEFYPYTGEA